MTRFIRLLRKHPTGAVGLAILVFWVFVAMLGPIIAPYSYTAINIDRKIAPPTIENLLGTDMMGRDVLSRIIYGSQSIMLIGLFSSLLSTVIGILIGFSAAYIGGKIEQLIMRIMDIFMAIPLLILSMVALAVFEGSNAWVLIIVLSLVFTPRTARVARSTMLTQKTLEYVDAARIRGERHTYIMFVEILPNALGPILVEGAARFAYSIMTIASLGFLGVGLQPPTPDWGRMVLENRQAMSMAPWAVLFPAISIATLVIGVSFISDFFEKAFCRGN
jgi:peptide/nickel transport system permease protein